MIGLLLVLTVCSPASASQRAEGFIQSHANDVVAVVNNRTATTRAKRADIWLVIDRSVNSEAMARATLGAYAAPIRQKEIDHYVLAFRRYLRARYAGELARAFDLAIEVTGSSELRGGRGTRVTSLVSIEGRRVREVDWRVVGDRFIADIEFDGVWMIDDLKKRLAPVLMKSPGKLDGAIAYLDHQYENGDDDNAESN